MAKHRPPSRKKYTDSHPQVGFRVPVKLRDDLHAYAQAKDMTLGVLMAQLIKNQKEPLSDFNEGYAFGYAQATIGELLKISCAKCRTPLEINQRQVVEVAEKLLLARHVNCPYCDEEKQVDVIRQ